MWNNPNEKKLENRGSAFLTFKSFVIEKYIVNIKLKSLKIIKTELYKSFNKFQHN